jgi:hypothetical protein
MQHAKHKTDADREFNNMTVVMHCLPLLANPETSIGIGLQRLQPVKTLIHRLEAYAAFVASKLTFA